MSRGQSNPDSHTVLIAGKMSAYHYDALCRLASQKRLPLSALVRSILLDYLVHHGVSLYTPAAGARPRSASA